MYGEYQDFIPLYVYSVIKNNPQIGIKIFLKETLSDANKALLQDFPASGLQIVENYFIPCPIVKLGGIRVLIPERDVSEFDYFYFSDVDMVNVQYMFGKIQIGIEKSKETGLPFNGLYYTSSFRIDGQIEFLPRFNLGSMFVEVKPYFAKMSRIIDEIHSGKHKKYMDKIKNLLSDELLLYYMLDQAFDLDVDLFKTGHFLHGLNLGGIRWGFKNYWKPTDAIEQRLVDHIMKKGSHHVKDTLYLCQVRAEPFKMI